MRLITFKEVIAVDKCSVELLLKAFIIEFKNSILYEDIFVLNNFVNKKLKSNFKKIFSEYKLSLLLSKSDKHLNISLSNIFLSINNTFIKFNNGSNIGSNSFFFKIRLKLPIVKNKAFLKSEFVFIFNNEVK